MKALPPFPTDMDTSLKNVSTAQNEELNCRTSFHLKKISNANRYNRNTRFLSEKPVQKENLPWEECSDEGLLVPLAYSCLAVYKKSRVSFMCAKLIKRQNKSSVS